MDLSSMAPEIIEGNLFALPPGEAIHIIIMRSKCGMCGKETSNTFFTLIAGRNFTLFGDVWKRNWYFLDKRPCDCNNCIWVSDGPIPKSFN